MCEGVRDWEHFSMRAIQQSSSLLLLGAQLVACLQIHNVPFAPLRMGSRSHGALGLSSANTGGESRSTSTGLFAATNTPHKADPDNTSDQRYVSLEFAVDTALEQRYACTRFQRFDGILNSTSIPSPANQTVLDMALQALDVSRRAPSGYWPQCR